MRLCNRLQPALRELPDVQHPLDKRDGMSSAVLEQTPEALKVHSVQIHTPNLSGELLAAHGRSRRR